jgi:4-amino-4-deoxy-L-arabinose transferase-like glycosyltransferase
VARARQLPWGVWLGAIAAAGLAIRLGYVFGSSHQARESGDAVYYHVGANLLADGEGFIHPVAAAFTRRRIEGADHPPAYIVYLASASLLGLRSFFAHQVWSCFLGMATVVVVGLTGRRIAGPQAGLVAAVLAAVFPAMWMPDGWVMSETMAIFSVALVILAAYRCWDEPNGARASWLGAALGLAALSRPELIVLGPLIAVPLFWYKRRRIAPVAVSVLLVGATTVAVVSPWVLHNLSRFDHVVLLSDQSGQTMAASWCDAGFYGDTLGYKSYDCLTRWTEEGEPSGTWLSYGRDHVERVPVVLTARVLRVWGLFRPAQQVKLEQRFGAEQSLTWATFTVGWVLLALGTAGALRLRRQGTPIFPLVAPIAVATLSIALTFGQLRYRAPVEPALALLAAGLWARPPPPTPGDDDTDQKAGPRRNPDGRADPVRSPHEPTGHGPKATDSGPRGWDGPREPDGAVVEASGMRIEG